VGRQFARISWDAILEQTKTNVERLEQVFEELDEQPKGKTCHGMKGLIEEAHLTRNRNL